MPGLFGYWARERQCPVSDRLPSMAKTMLHHHGLKSEMSSFPGFGSGRIHLGCLQPEAQPCADQGRRHSLWIDGEFCNGAELRRALRSPARASAGDAALALALYLESGWDFLAEADGLFTIAIYDHQAHRLTLANDRFGLRPLYWAESARGFAYAGEAKALLAVPGLHAGIDPLAVKEWFSFGMLLENRTWIQGIELLPPATILSVSADGIRKSRYWSWPMIEPRVGPTDEAGIVEELGRLWLGAIDRRVDDKRLGQLLSGGLDSRAILAALPSTRCPYHTLTFGSRGCDDARIARRVSALKGTVHHFVEINENNWLQARAGAVWRTDGMGRFLDLHGGSAWPTLATYCDVQLHGFLGDATIGGSYLGKADASSYLDARIVLKTQSGLEMADALGYVMQLQRQGGLTPEHFLFHQRGRRFINTGLISASAFVETRLPFFDLHFLTAALSLPPSLRAESGIYNKMLLRFFPGFFRSIPWQRTGLPIAPTFWGRGRHAAWTFARRAIRYASKKTGITPWVGSEHYADYPLWLRKEPGRTFLTRLLSGKESLHGGYLDHSAVVHALDDFLETGSNRNLTTIGLLLTFEIFLRRLSGRDPKQSAGVDPERSAPASLHEEQ